MNTKLLIFCQHFQVHKADHFRHTQMRCTTYWNSRYDKIYLLPMLLNVYSVKIMEKEKARSLNVCCTVSYENIIENQESNLSYAFLGLGSTFEVREEFSNYSMYFNDYAAKSMSET